MWSALYLSSKKQYALGSHSQTNSGTLVTGLDHTAVIYKVADT